MDIHNDNLFSNEQMSAQIRNLLDSKNYSDLAAYISNSVNNALALSKKGIKQGEYQIQKGIKAAKIQASTSHLKNKNSCNKNQKTSIITAPVAKVPSGTFAGPLLAAASVGAFVISVISLLNLLLAGTNPFFTGVLCVSLGCGLFFGFNSKKMMNRVTRFKNYLKCIDLSMPSVSISELANHFNKKEKFVQSDLNKMINLNMFPEGHISDDGKLFLLSNHAYNDYLKIKEEEKLQAANDEYRRKLEKEHPIYIEIHSIIREGEEMMIRLQNTIPLVTDKNVKEEISHLIDVIQRILEDVKNNPEHYPDIRRFMNYYLPMTWKIIDTYRELDSQPVCGMNILNAKREIESSLTAIISAYDNIFDELYQEKAFDVSSDIAVIKTMLSRDGLTK